MRFVWAVAAFVLAALMIGAGIAQRTVFQGPTTQTETIEVSEEVPYVLIDGAVLTSMPGSQTVRAQGEGTVFGAYGRTLDMRAWLSTSEYAHVVMDGESIDTEIVTPEPAEDATGEDAETAEGEPALDPVGSDLWLDEFQQEDLLITTQQLADDMSMLVAADGTLPAPSTLTVTWPLQTATPWSGPLIVAGAILMAVGVFLYILGIRHLRRSRGPRRKGLPVPVTEPIDLSIEQADKGVITSGAPSRRSLSGKARGFVVVPVLTASALAFTGCAADAWPQLGAEETPTPTPTVIVPEGQKPPVVTRSQAERIVQRISEQVAAADESLDAAAAGERLSGAALAVRATNYRLRESVADQAALAPVPDESLSILLPQTNDGWPRTFLAVAEDDADNSAKIMLATQEDAWSDYKISYMSSLEASVELPDLAPDYVGATQVAPDSQFLVMAPEDISAAYADVLNKGADSEYAVMFDEASDHFRTSVAEDRQARLDAFNQTGASTGSLTFESAEGTEPAVGLATLESGAIVAVNVNENETVKPTNEDAVIKLDGNPTVSTLAGATESAKGFTSTYSDQLFFYVPAQGSSAKIQLLGYTSNVLDAKVIP